MPIDRQFRFWGVGWTLRDHVLRVPWFPRENEKVAAIDGLAQVGGPAVRALMQLRRFGGACGLTSAVGDDSAGRQCVTELRAAGLDVSYIARSLGAPTRFAHVWLSTETGSRTIAYAADGPELNSEHATERLPQIDALISDARYPATAQKLAAEARGAGIPVIVDMGSPKNDLLNLIEQADVIIGPSATWEQLASELGHSHADDAMRHFSYATCVRTKGASNVIATRASEEVSYTPPKVTAIDANGAGDVFLGAFAWALVRGEKLRRALMFAANTSALKCTRFGNAGLPTLSEVEAFEANLRSK